jgi:DNA-binding beta-propeller fold protein YncE
MGEGNREMSSRSIAVANVARLGSSGRALLTATLCAAAALLVLSAPADALSQRGHEFKESFTFEQAGKDVLTSPSAVAIDEATSDVYVLDQANNRVLRFGPKHEFMQAWGYGVSKAGGETYEICEQAEASECHAGIPGYKKEQFDAPVAIAVDNSSASSSKGDVYVVANGSWRKPVVYKFSAAGMLLGKLIGRKEEKEETEGAIEGIAVDSTGDVWIEREDEEEEFLLQRFSDETPNQLLNSEEIEVPEVVAGSRPVRPGFAVSSGGDIYVTYEPGGIPLPLEEEEIKEREHERKERKEATKGETPAKPCVEHTCLVAKLAVTPLGTGLEAETVRSQLSEANTTGLAVDQSIEAQSSGDVYLDHATEVEALDSAGGLIQEFAPAGGLTAGRGIAVDAKTNEILLAEAAQDKIAVFSPAAAGPPTIELGSVSAGSVTSSSANLIATIDPDGTETRYRFEYGTQSCGEHPGSCTVAPAPPALGRDLGQGFGDQTALEPVSGLLAQTTYHVLAIAEYPGSSGTETVVSTEEATFRTSAPAIAGELPDGRAWELVSPGVKHGSSLEAIAREGGVIAAAANGKAFTYLAAAPLGESEPESNRAPEPAQIFASRQPGSTGWSASDIEPPEDEVTTGYNPGRERQYELFNPELTEALLDPAGEVPLSPEATEKTIYLRTSLESCVVPSACFVPLVDASDDTSKKPFGHSQTIFLGASPNLQHIVFGAEVGLTEGSPEKEGLYMWTAGQLELVDLVPGNTPAAEAYLGGVGVNEMRATAISENGEHVVFTGKEHTYTLDHIYSRNLAKHESFWVDEPDTGFSPAGEPHVVFQTATPDGSQVFFTDTQRLAEGSSASEGKVRTAHDLYVSEPERPAGQRVTDLTRDLNSGEAADVQGGVLGLGEEGSQLNIYFVADGVLAVGAKPGNCGPEAPTGAACNLYVAHYNGSEWEAEPRLIARLSNEDLPDWGGSGSNVEEYDQEHQTARVSPNGRYLAFMSNQRLTHYNNDDAVSGVADEEVFRYDYDEGKVTCVSCDPSGARPIGVHDVEESGEGKGLLIDRPETWSANEPEERDADHWLAASVPGWTNTGRIVAFYQSRYLLNNGRLFFNSASPLVPQDVNKNKADVYEYEPTGLGSCTVASENAENGCVALLSSGESEQESAFLDASESGEDVFFLTSAKLSPLDPDTEADVYDARVCMQAGSEPCPSYAPSPPAPCSSEACKAGYVPTTGLGSPATTSVSGSGNIEVLGVKEAKKAEVKRALTKAQLLAKALKSCKRDKNKHKRVSCEKQARKKYAPKKVATRSSTHGSDKS